MKCFFAFTGAGSAGPISTSMRENSDHAFPSFPATSSPARLLHSAPMFLGFAPDNAPWPTAIPSAAAAFIACGATFSSARIWGAYGVTLNGGFADYLKIKADRVYAIRNLKPREAIMVEPTACALHGIEVLNAKPGSDVLLFGAGPTGQVLAQLVKLNGAARLVVAAPPGKKLDLISKLAADEVAPMNRQDPEVHRRRLRELSPNGFDYVIEATGAATVCEEALAFVRRRGTLLIYGVYPEEATARFKPFDLFRGEISIKGSFAQVDSFGRALAYLENGRIKVDEIVTEEVPLSDYQRALELAWSRQGVKTMLVPNA